MKPFSRSSKAGFTLVELIVVIAILAILAGVAIPVYSGYIEKANQAADLQLLGAVNTSFAASCAEVGISSSDVSGAVLKVTDGCITGVNVSGLKPGVTPMFITASIAPTNGVVALSARPSQPFAMLLSATDAKAVISESFLKYFAGNTTTELKYYDGAGNFAFNPNAGIFEAFDNGAERTFTYVDNNGNAHTLSANTDDLNAYINSTFLEIGTQDLTSAIAGLASQAGASYYNSLKSNPAFNEFFSSLGIDTTGMTEEEIQTMKQNALVLWVADYCNGDSFDSDSVLAQLKAGENINSSEVDTNRLAAITATYYGLMYSYANSEIGRNAMFEPGILLDMPDVSAMPVENKAIMKAQLEKQYPNGNIVVTSGSWDDDKAMSFTVYDGEGMSYTDYFNGQSKALTWANIGLMYEKVAATEDWKTYMASKGSDDFAGYQAALSVVNDNINNLGTNGLQSLLTNGYVDDNFRAMIAAIFGN